jgi:predicted nucleic acid-binding protein
VPYLFDTDAISEVFRPKPLAEYVRWLETIPRADQFTSAVVVGELFKGAFRSPNAARHIRNIESRVLPSLSVIPYDLDVARVYGAIQAPLEGEGRILADADLQIAATALHHGLELVTGNLRHFRHIPGLRICTALVEARAGRQA